MLIIDDKNADRMLAHCQYGLLCSTGCEPRKSTYGSLPWAKPVQEAIKLIPRSEWAERIKARQGSLLSDLLKANKVPCYYQNGVSYCHSHAGALTAICTDLIQGNPLTIYAPESIGGPITGFRNRGASLDDVCQQMRTGGVCARKFIPENDINPRNWQDGWEADASLHKLLEWLDVGDFDELMTCLLNGLPVEIGLAWWRHAVVAVDPYVDETGKKFGVLIRNSHGAQYGEDGFAVLMESRATPDLGAFAPSVMTWTKNDAGVIVPALAV